MTIRIIVSVMGILFLFPVTSQAWIKKSTDSCNSGMRNLECRIVKTKTGGGEWLKPNHAYQFRTTDGSYCKIKGHLAESNNAKLVYNSTLPSRSGDWSAPGMVVERKGEGGWSFNLQWSVKCK